MDDLYQRKILYDSKILVVEDQAINLKILQIHLEKAGYKNLSFAKNGQEALDSIAIEKPDLIILDIMMPVMDGYEVTRQLRKQYGYNDLPIIIQTAINNPEEEQKVWQLGVNDIVHKPINKLEFISRIYVQLHQYWMFKELQDYKRTAEEDIKSSLYLQLSLLPNEKMIQDVENRYKVKIDSIFKPCRFLSGDLWGLTPIDDDFFCIWICDFSGKGIRAALNTFRLHTVFSNDSLLYKSPKEILQESNQILKQLLMVGAFSTCLYALVEPKTRKIKYASASSPNPILYNRQMKEASFLESAGLPLGVKKDTEYDEHFLALPENNSFILYSDAMWESLPDLGISFEEDKLASFIDDLDGKKIVPSLKMMIDLLGEEDLSLSDDLTIVEISFE